MSKPIIEFARQLRAKIRVDCDHYDGHDEQNGCGLHDTGYGNETEQCYRFLLGCFLEVTDATKS